ncbi:MAG: AAA family ATPase [Planctomycetes bacterium]|nr:AAA family ATPase [Planctomycetota bacterium]
MMGQPIDKITLKGFKSIRDLEDLPLRRLNILIGANGAGKSNFIDFFRLLREMVDGNLQRFVIEHGGADGFFFMGPKYTRRISARLEFGQQAYEFILAPTSSAELMFEGQQIHYAGGSKAGGATYTAGGGVREPAFKGPGDRESESGRFLAKLLDTMGLNISESVRSWIVYHFHDTSMLAPMRRIGSVRDNEYLRPDAGNLGAFLLLLRDQHQRTYEKIRDIVRLAAPFFDDFKFRPRPSNGDTTLHLEWTQKGSDYPFLVTQLSDGTLRFIALTTALLQPEPPTTILLDEPELGLHPYALNLLAALLKEAAASTQVIVSTQSAPLLDNFKAEDIVVVEREDGASTFQRQSSAELEEWLKNYSLGELWEKNVLGGRPSND